MEQEGEEGSVLRPCEGEENPMVQREKEGREEEERGQWTNPCDFFISCLGYAVGLGESQQLLFIGTMVPSTQVPSITALGPLLVSF